MPICPQHNAEMRWKEAGVSRDGRNYPAFWSCPQRNADLSFCKYRPPKDTSPQGTFAMQLDKSASQMDNLKKDMTITRLAIAKSLIGRGDRWGLESMKEAEDWLAWSLGKKPLSEGMTEEKEIPL